MSKIDERGKAIEGKYFRDEELNFKLEARRRKMLGLWAADRLHLSEEDSLGYALDIVKVGASEGGEAGIKKVTADLNEGGIEIDIDEVRKQSELVRRKAAKMIEEEYQD